MADNSVLGRGLMTLAINLKCSSSMKPCSSATERKSSQQALVMKRLCSLSICGSGKISCSRKRWSACLFPCVTSVKGEFIDPSPENKAAVFSAIGVTEGTIESVVSSVDRFGPSEGNDVVAIKTVPAGVEWKLLSTAKDSNLVARNFTLASLFGFTKRAKGLKGLGGSLGRAGCALWRGRGVTRVLPEKLRIAQMRGSGVRLGFCLE